MLHDPPLLTIKKDFARAPQAALDALAEAQTGHVVDALLGRGAMDASIKAIDNDRAQFIGTAFPVETGPSDNLAIAAGVALAKEGDVIVGACDAFERTAVCGDIVAMLGQNAGCAALVLDGMVRGVVGLVEVGLPIFARGITPNSCVRSGPGRVGLPIVAGGVRVEAGDVVKGDLDGVVVIPRAEVDRVVAAVQEICAAETVTIEDVQSGRTRMPFMDDLLRSERVKYVD
ncbi:MAG: RraA family protein [Hyphomicrobiaceae bacterium]